MQVKKLKFTFCLENFKSNSQLPKLSLSSTALFTRALWIFLTREQKKRRKEERGKN